MTITEYINPTGSKRKMRGHSDYVVDILFIVWDSRRGNEAFDLTQESFRGCWVSHLGPKTLDRHIAMFVMYIKPWRIFHEPA